MAEAESDGPERELNDIERVPSMTFWEKVGFLWFPSFWALIAAPLLLQFASYFFTFAFALLRHPQLFKQGAFWSWLAFLVANCAAFGAILVYPVRFFRKMRSRKKETGSLFLRGEELVAFRYRRKHPPAWMRIMVALFVCLLPLGITYKTMETPGHRVLAAWGVVALFWLIAIVVTVEVAWPRAERQWTGFVVSGAFGALAVMAGVGVIRYGDHKAYDWFFPLLFALLSGSAAVVTVRDGRKKSADAPRAGL